MQVRRSILYKCQNLFTLWHAEYVLVKTLLFWKSARKRMLSLQSIMSSQWKMVVCRTIVEHLEQSGGGRVAANVIDATSRAALALSGVIIIKPASRSYIHFYTLTLSSSSPSFPKLPINITLPSLSAPAFRSPPVKWEPCYDKSNH
jgi:hypothetical protein